LREGKGAAPALAQVVMEKRFMRNGNMAAILATLCCLAAAPTLAQNAESKPKVTGASQTVTVTVTNGRKVDLVQLQATESGSAGWQKVLGPLKAGKQAQAKLPQNFHCRVDIHGVFANGQSMDASDVDVCAQKTLNLTD
jgi:hypothetical protein